LGKAHPADRELGVLPREQHIKATRPVPVIGEDPDGRDVKPGAGGSQLVVLLPGGRPSCCPNVRCGSPMAGG